MGTGVQEIVCFVAFQGELCLVWTDTGHRCLLLDTGRRCLLLVNMRRRLVDMIRRVATVRMGRASLCARTAAG